MPGSIVFIAAGAVGGYVGAHLTRAGLNPLLVDPWSEHVSQMTNNGLQIQGVTEPECFTSPVRVISPQRFTNDIPDGSIDVAFIATKSYDTPWACELLQPKLAGNGVAVSLQNCINEPAIAQALGADRTVGCIASSITVGLTAPGLVQRNVPKGGEHHTVFRCGEMSGQRTERVEEIVSWLAHADSAKATDNLIGERWTKLIINASRNGLLACSGIDSKTLETQARPRKLCIQLTAEAIRVARAEQINLERISAIEPDVWLAAADEDATAIAAIETKMLADASTRRAGTQLSMGQDIAKQRRTEIDFINGLVVDTARRHGIAVPANEAIQQAVHRVESQQAAQSINELETVFGVVGI